MFSQVVANCVYGGCFDYLYNPTGDSLSENLTRYFRHCLVRRQLWRNRLRGIFHRSGIKATTQTENWLKIPAVYDRVIAVGYSDINEIERKGNGYEIKARNANVEANGEKVKLYA